MEKLQNSRIKNKKVTLVPLTADDREQFILDNQCGFHIVEFYNEFHINPNAPAEDAHTDDRSDEMFRFIKMMQ